MYGSAAFLSTACAPSWIAVDFFRSTVRESVVHSPNGVPKQPHSLQQRSDDHHAPRAVRHAHAQVKRCVCGVFWRVGMSVCQCVGVRFVVWCLHCSVEGFTRASGFSRRGSRRTCGISSTGPEQTSEVRPQGEAGFLVLKQCLSSHAALLRKGQRSF